MTRLAKEMCQIEPWYFAWCHGCTRIQYSCGLANFAAKKGKIMILRTMRMTYIVRTPDTGWLASASCAMLSLRQCSLPSQLAARQLHQLSVTTIHLICFDSLVCSSCRTLVQCCMEPAHNPSLAANLWPMVSSTGMLCKS